MKSFLKYKKQPFIFVLLLMMILCMGIEKDQVEVFAKNAYATASISHIAFDKKEKSPTLAVGTKRSLILTNSDKIKTIAFKSSDPSIASISKDGMITAKSKGTTVISMRGKDINGNSFSDKKIVTISDPKLSKHFLKLNIQFGSFNPDGQSIQVSGLAKSSTITCNSDTSNFKLRASKDKKQLSIQMSYRKPGDYTATVVIDGKTFVIPVTLRDLYFSKENKNILYPNESTTLTLIGASDCGSITYRSDDSSVAVVDQSGKVTAKGVGYTTIWAISDGISASYKIGVSDQTAVKALRQATKHPKKSYASSSQLTKEHIIFSANSTAKIKKYTSKMLIGDVILTKKEGKLILGIYQGPNAPDEIHFFNHMITKKEKALYDSFGKHAIVIRPYDQVVLQVSAATTSNDLLKLTWKKTFGASGYEVYRSSAKNGPYEKMKTTDKTQYIDPTAKKGKTYYYKVRAYFKSEIISHGPYSSAIKKQF